MTDYDAHIREAIDSLGRAGVKITNLSPSQRKHTLMLEETMTRAAETGDGKRFLEVLKRWKGIIIENNQAVVG